MPRPTRSGARPGLKACSPCLKTVLSKPRKASRRSRRYCGSQASENSASIQSFHGNLMIRIKNEELIRELVGEVKNFPRYTTQLINLANQNAQGTRPRVVGQLSELIKECPEKTYDGWRRWYLSKHPEAVKNATGKIDAMVKKLKIAIQSIDKAMITRWVEDLVLEKTFVGLRFQEAILKKVAAM